MRVDAVIPGASIAMLSLSVAILTQCQLVELCRLKGRLEVDPVEITLLARTVVMGPNQLARNCDRQSEYIPSYIYS